MKESAIRCTGWRSKLFVVLQEAQGNEFSWGSWDCTALASACVEAIIGVDLYSEFRGTYSSPQGALLTIRRAGYADLSDLVGSKFKALPRSMARVGDLAAIKAGETGWGLGVVIGSRIGVLAPTGYATVDLSAADHIYWVGK